jgi:isopentenyldiphosphate isomerase
MEHGATKEHVADMVRYFVMKMLRQRVEFNITNRKNKEIEWGLVWNGVRCHHPGCKYIYTDHFRVQTHVKGHTAKRKQI